MFILALFILLFIVGYFLSNIIHPKDIATAPLFGDVAQVKPHRTASIFSIISLLFIWGAFTGSVLLPIHVPAPFIGKTSFTYEASNSLGEHDSGKVDIEVIPRDSKLIKPKIDQTLSTGFVRNDAIQVNAWRSALIRAHKNDIGGRLKGYRIVRVDGQSIKPQQSIAVTDGIVSMTRKGNLSFIPDKGWQMEPIWLPAPEIVFYRFIELIEHGYQNISLTDNVGWSLLRVIAGFALGSLVGIPLGYAMGLNGWFRGWFDPIVEFMRPVPPLALIPLIIIWFGIWETGKISLLFLAALWIMTIAARSGVSGIQLAKVHAAYTLGASKTQLLRHVIIPNSLPEIFTGARVAMGICWGTVVAAELVAAEKGVGKMIIVASKFQQTDIVLVGIILIGIIGFFIDLLMRKAEAYFVPWNGKV